MKTAENIGNIKHHEGRLAGNIAKLKVCGVTPEGYVMIPSVHGMIPIVNKVFPLVHTVRTLVHVVKTLVHTVKTSVHIMRTLAQGLIPSVPVLIPSDLDVITLRTETGILINITNISAYIIRNSIIINTF